MAKSTIGYFLIFSSLTLALFAEAPPENAKLEKEQFKKEFLKEETSETANTININGVDISYKATTGMIHLKDEQGIIKASIFYVYYAKDGESDHSKRPITFCFNGGPGSSSVWLHMGVFGPKRVLLKDEEYNPPPYQIVNNEYSILDLTDLVFIDPVSTGYSRAAPGEDPKQFHGFSEDIQAIADFIRLFITRENRWDSPKFLAGESYGTTRAAGLALNLHNEHKIYLNGLILLSTVLNFLTFNDSQGGNDLPYILALPSYTATAWYHKKLSDSQQKDFYKTLKEAKEFASNEFALALLKGESLKREEMEAVVSKLSRFTGLSPSYIQRSNLRIPISCFTKELLRNEKRTLGRFDSRIKGIDIDENAYCSEYDPSFDAIFGAFTAAFNQYARTDLLWKTDVEYKALAKVVPWNYGKSNYQCLNVSDDLKEVMTKNPSIRVFVAAGYFDLATPFFAAEYTFNHLGLDPSLKDHIKMNHYEGGHMMYLNHPSLVKLKADLSKWINGK